MGKKCYLRQGEKFEMELGKAHQLCVVYIFFNQHCIFHKNGKNRVEKLSLLEVEYSNTMSLTT